VKNLQELSLVNIAEIILSEQKAPMDLYELFDTVLNRKDYEPENPERTLNNFYAELTSSAKFVYTGANQWDLKGNQKIDLWDKDGSFYNEYKEVSDAAMDERIAKEKEAEQAHQAMLEDRRLKEEEKQRLMEEKANAEAQEDTIEEVVADPLDDIEDLSEDLDEVITKEEEEPEKLEHDIEEDVEEEFEEDFDEDKYLEYMDDYEDEYDK